MRHSCFRQCRVFFSEKPAAAPFQTLLAVGNFPLNNSRLLQHVLASLIIAVLWPILNGRRQIFWANSVLSRFYSPISPYFSNPYIDENSYCFRVSYRCKARPKTLLQVIGHDRLVTRCCSCQLSHSISFTLEHLFEKRLSLRSVRLMRLPVMMCLIIGQGPQCCRKKGCCWSRCTIGRPVASGWPVVWWATGCSSPSPGRWRALLQPAGAWKRGSRKLQKAVAAPPTPAGPTTFNRQLLTEKPALQ